MASLRHQSFMLTLVARIPFTGHKVQAPLMGDCVRTCSPPPCPTHALPCLATPCQPQPRPAKPFEGLG